MIELRRVSIAIEGSRVHVRPRQQCPVRGGYPRQGWAMLRQRRTLRIWISNLIENMMQAKYSQRATTKTKSDLDCILKVVFSGGVQ